MMLPCFVVASEAKQAIPIFPVTTADLEQWLATQESRVANWVQATAFTAKPDSYCLVPNSEGRLATVIAGVSALSDFWALANLPVQLPPGDYTLMSNDSTVQQQVAIAWGLAAYQFHRYKSANKKPVARLCVPFEQQAKIERTVQALYLVRDLINTPTEDMGPAQLAAAAQELGQRFQAQVRVIVGDALLTENYPLIHTVGRASSELPRLIDLQWGNPAAPKITLVGKGVCFDSGGLDLKPSSGMLLMKKDMAGAAHVLGLAQLIMDFQLPVRLRVLIPAVENAVSGNAFRPGDILRTRKGISVEIGNTDAEGRLILADALTEAAAEQPQLIIDFATLTGAARSALGTDLPALFTQNDQVAEQILSAAQQMQDPCWRLPLYRPYRKMLDSPIADINNSSASGYAGAITAALFLNEFILASIPWVHLDLMAWNIASRPGRPEGGEAMMVRTLFHFLQQKFVI